jgi:hypothetical protein
VETKLDFDDRSEWIMVERDSALCKLHNRDVDILYGWPNFEKKFCVFVSYFNLLPVLAQIYSFLEFDLTLDLIPRVYIASSCSRYRFISQSTFLLFKVFADWTYLTLSQIYSAILFLTI